MSDNTRARPQPAPSLSHTTKSSQPSTVTSGAEQQLLIGCTAGQETGPEPALPAVALGWHQLLPARMGTSTAPAARPWPQISLRLEAPLSQGPARGKTTCRHTGTCLGDTRHRQGLPVRSRSSAPGGNALRARRAQGSGRKMHGHERGDRANPEPPWPALGAAPGHRPGTWAELCRAGARQCRGST